MHDLFIVITISSQGTPLNKDFTFSGTPIRTCMYLIFCFLNIYDLYDYYSCIFWINCSYQYVIVWIEIKQTTLVYSKRKELHFIMNIWLCCTWPLTNPKTNLKSSKGFYSAAPDLWNGLPYVICHAVSLKQFKSLHYFALVFLVCCKALWYLV